MSRLSVILSLFLSVLILSPLGLTAEGDGDAAGTSELVLPSENGTGIPVAYQVGAFLNKANAERLVKALLTYGFAGNISEKVVGGNTFWVVTVAAAINPFENRQQELLDAGFPSFPVR